MQIANVVLELGIHVVARAGALDVNGGLFHEFRAA